MTKYGSGMKRANTDGDGRHRDPGNGTDRSKPGACAISSGTDDDADADNGADTRHIQRSRPREKPETTQIHTKVAMLLAGMFMRGRTSAEKRRKEKHCAAAGQHAPDGATVSAESLKVRWRSP